MKQTLMSVMVVISVIVFSASLCSAGLFGKKTKKKVTTAFEKCVSTRNARMNKCIEQHDLFDAFEAYNKCVDKVLAIFDDCSDPNKWKINEKEMKKAAKQLKKIESAEDKCGKNWLKDVQKCGKLKTRDKRVRCADKANAKGDKCDAKVKKMREKL